MVGSGPYTLAKYTPGVQTVLQANALFKGPKPKTDLVIMQYFDTSSTLKQAIQSGTVDIAFRSLTPTDLDSLKTTKGVQVITGASAETRQLQINASAPPRIASTFDGLSRTSSTVSRSRRTSTKAPWRRCTQWYRVASVGTPTLLQPSMAKHQTSRRPVNSFTSQVCRLPSTCRFGIRQVITEIALPTNSSRSSANSKLPGCSRSHFSHPRGRDRAAAVVEQLPGLSTRLVRQLP